MAEPTRSAPTENPWADAAVPVPSCGRPWSEHPTDHNGVPYCLPGDFPVEAAPSAPAGTDLPANAWNEGWLSLGDAPAGTEPTTVWQEAAAERERAHLKHQDTSMEQQPVDALLRLSILTEEVGEVAKELNDARHRGHLDYAALRKELIQVTAMAGAWADALTPYARGASA